MATKKTKSASAKRVTVSPTKAYRIEAVQIGEQQGISIRQMYATKKDPAFKPARQGIFLPLEVAEKVLRIAGRMSVSEDTEFAVIERAAKED